MQTALTIIIVVLAGIVLVVFGAAIYGQYELLQLEGSQRFSLLPGIAISGGVLIAALTFIRERDRMEAERQRHRSEVLFARASDGFRTVVGLLSDQNNSRIIWIQAARMLLRAVELGREIHAEEYKIAYELEVERTRNDLYKALSLPDDKSKGRRPLPPQFFYGIDDWAKCETLDEAAIRASQEVKAYSVTIDAVPPRANLLPLAPRSVSAIFDFIQYPKNYDDPLDDVNEWDENWDRSFDIDQGARRYVAHRKQKFAIGGKLHDRKSS